MKKISIIGVGNLGSAIAQSIEQHFPEMKLCLCEKDLSRLDNFEHAQKTDQMSDAVQDADIVVLAIKPQTFVEIGSHLQFSENTMVISVMAGLTTERITSLCGHERIVRTMPNLPLVISEGVIGYYFGFTPNEAEHTFIQSLLTHLGTCIAVSEETQLDAITALSGSGPAYFYLLAQSLETIAAEMGFSRVDAQKIAQATLVGSGALLNAHPSSTQSFIDRIASKGGTTEAALHSFSDMHYDDIVKKAVMAAFLRCKELNQ